MCRVHIRRALQKGKPSFKVTSLSLHFSLAFQIFPSFLTSALISLGRVAGAAPVLLCKEDTELTLEKFLRDPAKKYVASVLDDTILVLLKNVL